MEEGQDTWHNLVVQIDRLGLCLPPGPTYFLEVSIEQFVRMAIDPLLVQLPLQLSGFQPDFAEKLPNPWEKHNTAEHKRYKHNSSHFLIPLPHSFCPPNFQHQIGRHWNTTPPVVENKVIKEAPPPLETNERRYTFLFNRRWPMHHNPWDKYIVPAPFSSTGDGRVRTVFTVYREDRLLELTMRPHWSWEKEGLKDQWGQLTYQIWSEYNTSNPFIHGSQV